MNKLVERSDVGHQEDDPASQTSERETLEEDVAQDVAFVSVPLATTMLWPSIILPITPPALLAEAINVRAI